MQLACIPVLLGSAGLDPLTGSHDPPLVPWLSLATGASFGLRTRIRGHRMDGEALLCLSPLEHVSLALVSQGWLTATPGGLPDILKPQARGPWDGSLVSQSEETHKRRG